MPRRRGSTTERDGRSRVSTAPQQTNIAVAARPRRRLCAARRFKGGNVLLPGSAQGALGAHTPSLERSSGCAPPSFIQQRANEFQQSLDRALAEFRPKRLGGADPAHPCARHARGQAVDLPAAAGRLYYPYLAQRQFFEREEFDWVPTSKPPLPPSATSSLALLDEGADFRPYVEDRPDRPRRQFHHLNDDPSWTALYLWRDGQLVPEVAEPLPRTVEALEQGAAEQYRPPHPRRALFTARAGSAHSAAQRNAQLPADLPPSADRAEGLLAARRQRDPRVGGRQAADLRRQHRARSEEHRAASCASSCCSTSGGPS